MPSLPLFPSLGFLEKYRLESVRQKTPSLSCYGKKSNITQKLPSLHYSVNISTSVHRSVSLSLSLHYSISSSFWLFATFSASFIQCTQLMHATLVNRPCFFKRRMVGSSFLIDSSKRSHRNASFSAF